MLNVFTFLHNESLLLHNIDLASVLRFFNYILELFQQYDVFHRNTRVHMYFNEILK
jgi:hypothetical protein